MWESEAIGSEFEPEPNEKHLSPQTQARHNYLVTTGTPSRHDSKTVVSTGMLRIKPKSNEQRHEKTGFLLMRKQSRRSASAAVNAKLISAFVFATWIVQLTPKISSL